MAEIMRLLRDEHGNLAKVLDILNRQVEIVAAGDPPDFDLLESILEYTLNYPDLCHHPKEDRIYQKLRARDAAAARAVGDLHDEHRRLGGTTRRFAAAVRNLRRDPDLPRGVIANLAREYLDFADHHMRVEESTFFPIALESLTDSDWVAIDSAVVNRIDPLFGLHVQKAYQLLHAEIRQPVPTSGRVPATGDGHGRARHSRSDAPDRRCHSRVETFLAGTLTCSDEILDCTVLDMSIHGAQVRLSVPGAAGTAATLEITRIGGTRGREKDLIGPALAAEIVWHAEDCVGLRFAGAPDDLAQPMDEILSQAGLGAVPERQ